MNRIKLVYVRQFFANVLVLGGIVGKSCSSQGYQMATTQSECENIARRLGLSDTSATTTGWNYHDCWGQIYYRCSYYENELRWLPSCGDNTSPSKRITNLCTANGSTIQTPIQLLLSDH